MSNYATGHLAEKQTADYLKRLGYKILELNWKTKYCEIDIIAEKNKTIYFVEVKSRRNDLYGSGLEYITPKKLKQMEFAAKMWLQTNDWDGDYSLAAAEVKNKSVKFLTEL